MAKLDVMILQKDCETTISIGFPGGPSTFAFFFPEAESPKELQEQQPSRSIQRFMEMCHEAFPDRSFYEEGGGFVTTLYTLSFLISGGLSMVIPRVGLPLLFFTLLSLVPYRAWRMKDEPARRLRREREQYLAPIRERLYAYAKNNDFKGALDFAYNMSRDIPED